MNNSFLNTIQDEVISNWFDDTFIEPVEGLTHAEYEDILNKLDAGRNDYE